MGGVCPPRCRINPSGSYNSVTKSVCGGFAGVDYQPTVKKASYNPLRLFNSVYFGIALMVLIGGYIAVGSGCAWVREAFEMDELQFFDAWPLKVLMGLLVANLTVVTWIRIPLTPPRYGVWCVHAGIISLILGTSFYYHNKIEGTTRLYTDPQFGPVSIDHFYDRDERALYLKIDGTGWNWYALPSLPRFKAYDAALGNAGELKGRNLKDIQPYVDVQDDKSTAPIRRSLSQTMGWKDELKLAVIGYFPYANIVTRFHEESSANAAGVRVTLPEMHEGQEFETWLVASDPRYRFTSLESTDLEHRIADASTLAAMTDAAQKIFQLDIKLPNYAATIYVQPGKTYPLEATGYTLEIENFDPAWSMFGTHEIVQALTMKVTSPTQTFRRMVLDGRDLQTDFKLGDADAPPMGKRQKTPLDSGLAIGFKFNDGFHLLPREGSVKHTLVTGGDIKGMTDLVAGFSTAANVRAMESGAGEVEITPADPMGNAPFAKMPGAAGGEAVAEHPKVKLHVERKDHVQREDSVEIVPPAKRTRDAGESGVFQVLRVRATLGAWSQDVLVPYSADADDVPWDGGLVKLPTGTMMQLQLGQAKRPLPARLTLEKFDVVPYPGGDTSTRSMMLDFRSTLKIEDPSTGDWSTEVAHMNNPVYFGTGSWLFFQAAYDGDEKHWTILGVGNRPGVWVMIGGCMMIVSGVLYAFYLKPVIIRSMKKKAIARAAEKAEAKLALVEGKTAGARELVN